LQGQGHEHRLVYLDNAATTQKPQAVLDAILDYYRTTNANVHRGAYGLAIRATEAYEAARERVARFLNAWAPEGVVFTRGTTEAINLVAGAYGRANLRQGDMVVVTAMDHHSNLVPWQILCQEKGAVLISKVWDDHSTYNKIPHKFEAGTPNVEGAVGLAAAIDYLERIGLEQIAEHEQALAKAAIERLSQIDGVVVYGPRGHRAGVVSFTYGDVHPHDIATILDQDGICIRAGHHCTQPLMRRLNVAATARASFYLYNDLEDVEA